MTEVATITSLPENGDVDAWTEGQRAIADAAGLVFTHTYGAKEGQREPAPRAVVEKFLHVCRTTGLDPLTRQIYCIGRLSGSRVEWAIQTSIDGFRVIAERSQKYAGQDDAEWLTEKGEWTDVFVKQLHGNHPLAARVRVHRNDWTKPATGIATWESYVQTKRNGDPTSMWEKMGPLMLAKCAEALAFRKAFPQDLSGLYTGDEMSQASSGSVEAPRAQNTAVSASGEAPAPTGRPEQSKPVEAIQESGVDYLALSDQARSADEVLELFNQARDAGALGQEVEVNGEKLQLRAYLRKLGTALREDEERKAAAADDGVIDAEVVTDDGEPAAIWEPGDVDTATGEVAEVRK